MATASKLIHSKRKSQYIQVPAGAMHDAYGSHAPNPAAAPSAASRTALDTTPRAQRATDCARQRARTPDHLSTPRRSMTPSKTPTTPRRVSTSTPACARGAASARNCASVGTPRGAGQSTPRGRIVPSSPFCLPSADVEDGLADGSRRYACEADNGLSSNPSTLHRLELENGKLKRKLSKARSHSRERLNSTEQGLKQLSVENSVLRQECESLRSLFIRQQQQQISFWSGPFMEMILPKSTPQMNVDEDAARCEEACLKSNSIMVNGGYGQTCVEKREHGEASKAMGLSDMDANAAQAECVRSLLQDRDYWQNMASQLQTKMPSMHRGAPLVHLSLEKGIIDNLDTVETRSTSHQSSVGSAASECGVNAEMASSDSGTESTRSTSKT